MAAEMFCIISLIVITEIRKIFIIELSEIPQIKLCCIYYVTWNQTDQNNVSNVNMFYLDLLLVFSHFMACIHVAYHIEVDKCKV